jgi:type II secretory pathway pseudopilin PulG
MALVMVLAAVTVLSLATLVPLRSEQQALQRERERELLFIGGQFRQALASYAAASPKGAPQSPKTLAELVEDKRFPGVRRHLRRVYADPMTGKADWTLLKEQALIIGVASSSARVPLKHSGFALAERDFAEAATYADWKFVHTQGAASVAAAGEAPAPASPLPGATLPTTPVANPGSDKGGDCLRAFMMALNQCGRDPATSAQCRIQAGVAHRACLRG